VGGAPGVLSSNYRLLQANLFLWAFFGHCWQKPFNDGRQQILSSAYQTTVLRIQNSILEGLIPDLVFKNGPDMDPDLILMILSLLTPGLALVLFCYKFEFSGEQ
jgi:hypothetical protein